MSNFHFVSLHTALPLPYTLLELKEGQSCFFLRFLGLEEGQTEESIRLGGISGEFGILFQEPGIDAEFRCWLTIGEVYQFYQALQDCLKNLSGEAVLSHCAKEYSFLKVHFNQKGYGLVEGTFRNHQKPSLTGALSFSLSCDQTYFSLSRFERLFAELAQLQGSDKFF